jgi:hypothetical protein
MLAADNLVACEQRRAVDAGGVRDAAMATRCPRPWACSARRLGRLGRRLRRARSRSARLASAPRSTRTGPTTWSTVASGRSAASTKHVAVPTSHGSLWRQSLPHRQTAPARRWRDVPPCAQGPASIPPCRAANPLLARPGAALAFRRPGGQHEARGRTLGSELCRQVLKAAADAETSDRPHVLH